MRTRILLAFGIAVGVGLFWHVRQVAQEAQPEAAVVTREYDVEALLQTPPVRELGTAELDVWRLDGLRDEAEDVQWHLNSSSLGSAIDLKSIMDALDRYSEIEDWEITASPGRRLVVTATEQIHGRVSAVVQWLRVMSNARVHIEVLRLDAAPGKTVLSNAESKAVPQKLVGMQDVANGGRALFSDVKRKTLTWSVSPSHAGALPQASEIAWGRQWQVGALVLPEGRIQLTGWSAAAELAGVRRLETPLGVIELPVLDYRHASATGVIESGGGLVCDAGPDGWFLFRANCDARLDHMSFGEGEISLWNPAGALRPGDLDGGWFLRDAPGQDWSGSRGLPQLQSSKGAIVYPGSPQELAAKQLMDSLDPQTQLTAGVVLYDCKPMLAVSWDRHLANSYAQQRADLTASLKRATAGASHAAYRVRLQLVPPETALPEGIVAGRPDAAEVETITRLGKALADRRVRVALGQTGGCCDLSLRNFVYMYWMSTALSDQRVVEPEIATFADGWQVSIRPGESDAVVVRAGHAPRALWRTIKLQQDFAGLTVQRPEVSLAEVQLDTSVAVGRSISGVSTLADGTRLVVVVSRED